MINLHHYRGKVLKVVDGDTVDILIDLGFEVHRKVRCRLLGVNTPERGKENYKEATNVLARLIQENLDEDGMILFSSRKGGKRGSFRRWLIEIPNVTDRMSEWWPA